jgi:hypothetical protein
MRQREQVLFFKMNKTLEYEQEHTKSYSGKFKNIAIKIGYCPKRDKWYVELSGSVHKFFNQGKHNHNDFRWSDFQQVYSEIIDLFKINPEIAELVGVEFGVNIVVLFEHLSLTVPEIIDNILEMFGKCNIKVHTVENKRNSYKTRTHNRYLKAYSKSLQYGLHMDIIRLELGYTRARDIQKHFKIAYFSDLNQIHINELGKVLLLNAFETLHMHQSFLQDLPSGEIESNPDVISYGYPSFWCRLKKKDKNDIIWLGKERRN